MESDFFLTTHFRNLAWKIDLLEPPSCNEKSSHKTIFKKDSCVLRYTGIKYLDVVPMPRVAPQVHSLKEEEEDLVYTAPKQQFVNDISALLTTLAHREQN